MDIGVIKEKISNHPVVVSAIISIGLFMFMPWLSISDLDHSFVTWFLILPCLLIPYLYGWVFQKLNKVDSKVFRIFTVVCLIASLVGVSFLAVVMMFTLGFGGMLGVGDVTVTYCAFMVLIVFSLPSFFIALLSGSKIWGVLSFIAVLGVYFSVFPIL